MSIVLTTPGGSPGTPGTVKVSPSPVATFRRTFAPLAAQLKGQPVTLDFSEQMGLAVKVTPPTTPVSKRVSMPAFIKAANLPASAGTKVMAASSPTKTVMTTPTKVTIATPAAAKAAGQSVLNKRPSPVFTIAPKNKLSPGSDTRSPVKQTDEGSGSPTKLRELLMAQLDLIQRQSEAIVTKDRQLQQLRKENKQLIQRLKEFNEEAVRVEVVSPAKRKASVCDKAVETEPPASKRPRKKANSFSSSQGGHESSELESEHESADDDDEEEDEEEPEQPIIETQETYFTFQGEEFCRNEALRIRSILSQSEVPQWRETSIGESISRRGGLMPGRCDAAAGDKSDNENLSDDFVLRRHDKPEALEKRRKRWDLQVLRQQRQCERLRAAGEMGESPGHTLGHAPTGVSDAASSSVSYPKTFFPDPDAATHIHVGESLPVTAFGHPLPQLSEDGLSTNFSLPFEADSVAMPTPGKRKGSLGGKKSLTKQ